MKKLFCLLVLLVITTNGMCASKKSAKKPLVEKPLKFIGEFTDYSDRKWENVTGGWMTNIEIVKTSYTEIGYYYDEKTNVTTMKPVIKQGDDRVKRGIKKCPICGEFMHFKFIYYVDHYNLYKGFGRKDYIVVNDLEVHPKCWEGFIMGKIKQYKIKEVK